MENILERIIDNYGYETQSRKAMEELGELTVAINKYLDEPTKKRYSNLVEEIADVEIMLEQLKIMHDIEENEVLEVKNMKIERELQRIGVESPLKEAFNSLEESMNKVVEVAKEFKPNVILQSYKECTSTDFVLKEEEEDEKELQKYMREKEREEIVTALNNFLKGFCRG